MSVSLLPGRSLRAVALALAAILSCAVVAEGAAQDQPFLFLHGTGLTGAQWQVVADSLATYLHISDSWPTIGQTILGSVGLSERGGYASVASMENSLSGYVTGTGPYGVVAHGTLGLVTRALIQSEVAAGQPSKINELLTIATPHKGAPIARVALDAGNVTWPTLQLDQRFGRMDQMWPGVTFTAYPDQTAWYTNVWFPVLQQMATSRSGAYVGLATLVGIALPVTADLDPRNPWYVTTLNSATSLQEEGGTARAYIVGLTSNQALFSKAWLPMLWPTHSPASLRSDVASLDRLRQYVAWGLWTAALLDAAATVDFYMQNGLPPCLTNLQYQYASCVDQVSPLLQIIAAAYLVDNLNRYWADWIGAHGDNTSDAWLPDSTQFYPGVDTLHRLTNNDVYHGLEPRESGSQVGFVMQDFWGIQQRILPLSNSISQQGSYYTSNPAGGKAPYSFLWEWCATNCGGGAAMVLPQARSPSPNLVSGGWTTLPSTAQTIYWTGPHPATLRSTVTDALGSQAMATYYIQ